MKDADIRPALDARLRLRYAGQEETIIVHELGIQNGLHRVDIAVVNGILAGYEIKSTHDTLQRLPKQIAAYGQVFDRMTIVTTDKHISEVEKLVPQWWGVRVITRSKQGFKVESQRQERENSNLDAYALASLMWRGISLELLRRRGLDRGLRSATRERIWDALAYNLPMEELRTEVRTAIRRQQAWLAAQAQSQTESH